MKWVPIHEKHPPYGKLILLTDYRYAYPRIFFAVVYRDDPVFIDNTEKGYLLTEYSFKELCKRSKEESTIYWTRYDEPEPEE